MRETSCFSFLPLVTLLPSTRCSGVGEILCTPVLMVTLFTIERYQSLVRATIYCSGFIKSVLNTALSFKQNNKHTYSLQHINSNSAASTAVINGRGLLTKTFRWHTTYHEFETNDYSVVHSWIITIRVLCRYLIEFGETKWLVGGTLTYYPLLSPTDIK